MTIPWIILDCIAIVILAVLLIKVSIKNIVPHIIAMLEYLEENQI